MVSARVVSSGLSSSSMRTPAGREAAVPPEAGAVNLGLRAHGRRGLVLSRRVLEVVAHRLQATRNRLLDLYAPHGSGSTLTTQ